MKPNITSELAGAGVTTGTGERWMLVRDVETHAVSSHGQVFARPRMLAVKTRSYSYECHREGRIMAPFVGDDGMRISIGVKHNKPGARYIGTIARLMLLTFVGDPPPDICKLVVIHKDGNVYNDRLDNLMWGTRGLPERVRDANKMIEIGLAGGTLDDARCKLGMSEHHTMELARALREAAGGPKWQPWPITARALEQIQPDLFHVLRSRGTIMGEGERRRRKGLAVETRSEARA